MIKDPKKILEAICSYYGIKMCQLAGKTRAKRFQEPRYVASKILKDQANLSLFDIGDYLNKDHSSIIHYLRTFRFNYNANKSVEDLSCSLNGNK